MGRGRADLALEIGRRTRERLGVRSERVERSIAELRRVSSEETGTRIVAGGVDVH